MGEDMGTFKPDFKDILYKEEARMALITLNRPECLNAFRTQTLLELAQALKRAARDKSVGVIVLTGAGGKAFSVGGDITEMKELDRARGRVFVRHLGSLTKAFLTCPKPIIARVDGYCLGGGNEIQLFCDLTIASDRSFFGQTGPKVGSAPLWGGTQILPGLVGLKKAKEITFLCKHYRAEEAVAMGLINQCVPASELDRTVREVCQELLKKGPQSLKLAKKSLHGGLLRQVLQDLKSLQTIYGSPELKEGMAAFLEKREPRFTEDCNLPPLDNLPRRT